METAESAMSLKRKAWACRTGVEPLQKAMRAIELLAESGPLAEQLDNYEPRPSQLEMSEAVDLALAQADARLLVEAGTGVGKSLAYLAPALCHDKPVVVATGTKALQEQLARKDAPMVARALRDMALPEPRITVVKGRKNYLCLLRFERFRQQLQLPGMAEEELGEAIETWAQSSASGDRAELDFLPEDWAGWHDIDAGSETCIGGKCLYHDDCFIVRLRERARRSQLIITNHHLLMADASLRLAQRFGEIPDAVELLPEHAGLIIDEAHGLRDVATSAFGASLSSAGVEHLARDLRTWIDAQQDLDAADWMVPIHEIEMITRQLMQAIANLMGEQQRIDPSLFSRHILDLVKKTLASHDQLSARLDRADDDDSAAQALALRVLRQRRALEFICGAKDPDYVYFLERGRRLLRLVAAPIDVAQALAETIFAPGRSVVLTSATLSTDQGFSALREMLGLQEQEVQELQLASPFPYPKLIRYYLPKPTISPTSDRHIQRVAEECLALCQRAQGGAFLLFTSYRVLDAVFERIAGTLSGLVLRQGQGPRHQLVEQFRQHGNAVLFGTHSFWEGIDVQGAALRLVVIDRLPFASPANPLHAARSQRLETLGRRPFKDLSLPQAILDLKQGVGRLVRSAQDRGVVALLDGRLLDKGYGRRFMRALPQAPVVRDLDAVATFFNAPPDL